MYRRISIPTEIGMLEQPNVAMVTRNATSDHERLLTKIQYFNGGRNICLYVKTPSILFTFKGGLELFWVNTTHKLAITSAHCD